MLRVRVRAGRAARNQSSRGRRVVACIAVMLLASAAAPPPERGVTVEEIVDAEHYVNPKLNVEIVGDTAKFENFIYSPDGVHALYLVRRGDLATNTVRFGLHMVTLSEPSKGVFSDRELIAFSSGTNVPGISQIRWIDEATIGFVAVDGLKPPQIYSLGIDGSLVQRSASDLEKSGFDIGPHGRTLFGEVVPRANSESQKRDGYVLGKGTLSNILGINSGMAGYEIHYVVSDHGHARRLTSVSVPLKGFDPFVSISPSGRYAVVATAPQFTPKSWAALPLGWPIKAGDPAMSYFMKLELVDLDRDVSYPLTEAPMATPDFSAQLVWDEAHGSVILVDQWVTEETGKTIPGLSDFRHPVTFEYSLAEHRPTALIDILPHTGYRELRANVARELWLDREGNRLAVARLDGTDSYRRQGKGWVKAAAGTPCDICRTSRLTLDIDQNLDRAPRMIATETATGRASQVGPILNQALLPKLAPGRLYEWKDREGRTWQANLILPPGDRGDAPLPLVIEPHSFHPDEFIFTGDFGTTGAYAAQSLASAGIAVLVMGTQSPEQTASPDEFAIEVEGMRSAVADLARKGIVDKGRVGIVAWSRAGFWLQHAMAFQDDLFAAAIAADASSFGKFAYLYFHNWGDHQRDYLTENGGVRPFGEGMEAWLRTDPVTHGGAFNVPLRIEDYGSDVPLWWETYAAMQEEGKPVEMFEFPGAEHDPIQPRQQAILQHGSVDWFRFWLLGERNAKPLDPEEYDRWSKLCKLRIEFLKSRDAASPDCQRAM